MTLQYGSRSRIVDTSARGPIIWRDTKIAATQAERRDLLNRMVSQVLLAADVQQRDGGVDVNEENPGGFPLGEAGDQLRHQVADFMLAFDSNMAPIVGQQITLQKGDEAFAHQRIDLMRARADVGECDLVVKGNVAEREVGLLYVEGASSSRTSLRHRTLRTRRSAPSRPRPSRS